MQQCWAQTTLPTSCHAWYRAWPSHAENTELGAGPQTLLLSSGTPGTHMIQSTATHDLKTKENQQKLQEKIIICSCNAAPPESWHIKWINILPTYTTVFIVSKQKMKAFQN